MYYSTLTLNETKNLLIPEKDIEKMITNFFSQLLITNLRINRIIKNDLLDASFFENPTVIKEQESKVITLINNNYNTSIRTEETKILSDINELSSNLRMYSQQIESLLNHPDTRTQQNYEYCFNKKLIPSATEKQEHVKKTTDKLETFLEELRTSLQSITTEFKKIKNEKKEDKDLEKIENLKSIIISIENTADVDNQLVVNNGLLFGKIEQENADNPQKNLQFQITNIKKNKLSNYLTELKKIDPIESMTMQYESLLNTLINTIDRLITSNKEIQENFFAMEIKALATLKNTKISEKPSEIKEIVSTTKNFFESVATFTLYFMNNINQEIPNDFAETDLAILDRTMFERIFIKKNN